MQKTTHSAGGVIIGPHNKIAVVNQHGTSWSLPKGHLEGQETPRQAAEREITEETGLTQFEYLADLGSYTRYRIGREGGEDRTEHKQLTFYLFRTTQTHLAPIDPHNPESHWLDPADVAPRLSHPADKAFFISILPTIQTHIH
jgi:ADP-ribose pyrophosphatase YjhB (NUDIX family)